MPSRKIGLIAGNRQFPFYVADFAKAQGVEVVALALHEETSPELESHVSKTHWLHLGEIGKLLQILKEEQIKEVLMAGQVHPTRATGKLPKLDAQGMKLLARAATRQGADLLKLFADFLAEQGYAMLDSSTFLKDWLPEPGVLTKRKPSNAEQQDIAFGVEKVRGFIGSKVGQTLVVKNKAVVAVEAVEGTDATIRRAGEVAGPGCVVVKMADPNHDMRFDIPVVGFETVQAMVDAKATALVVAAGKTLLLEREKLLTQANQNDQAWVAV